MNNFNFKKNNLILRHLLIILFLFSNSLFPVQIDRQGTKRVLELNREYLEFIDVSVSNFGSEKNKDDLIKANQHFYDAKLFYLQNQNLKSYEQINKSLEILKYLYMDIIENKYLPETKELLNITSRSILHSNDLQAAYYLNQGYSQWELSRQKYVQGKNFNRYLFSTKLSYFREAIEVIRLSKRYALLAIIESKTPIFEKKEYKKITYNDVIQKDDLTSKISNFEKVQNNLQNIIYRKLIADENNFFLHHYDSYKKFASGKNSVLHSGKNQLKDSQLENKQENKIKSEKKQVKGKKQIEDKELKNQKVKEEKNKK
ncbi:MAG: hypothetical protein OEZ22_10775 [Spirochaetia bacterium]|nr:hypothetical protein [Spirochaetia bacterium]